jgi:hypothetical protein
MPLQGGNEALKDWIEHMLEDTVGQGDSTEGKPDKGCPQGVALPPLLWCIVINNLPLKRFTAGTFSGLWLYR